MHERDWQADVRLHRRRERASRALLGVSETAGRAEIRQAFRRAALASHPDVNPGDDAPGRFRLIYSAYKCLTRGEFCAALDQFEAPPDGPADTRYRLDNPWGYWCWWRERYFRDDK